MQQWREQFPGDVRDEDDFYATQREARRADRRRHRDFINAEVDKPGSSTLDDEDPRWDDMWTETTSDNE
jgi:hypothetical protein